jgi:hypothetical protein
LLHTFFAIPDVFLFWKELKDKCVQSGPGNRPELEPMKNMEDKTMKTLHSLLAGVRPASLIPSAGKSHVDSFGLKKAFSCFVTAAGFVAALSSVSFAQQFRDVAANSTFTVVEGSSP